MACSLPEVPGVALEAHCEHSGLARGFHPHLYPIPILAHPLFITVPCQHHPIPCYPLSHPCCNHLPNPPPSSPCHHLLHPHPQSQSPATSPPCPHSLPQTPSIPFPFPSLPPPHTPDVGLPAPCLVVGAQLPWAVPASPHAGKAPLSPAAASVIFTFSTNRPFLRDFLTQHLHPLLPGLQQPHPSPAWGGG